MLGPKAKLRSAFQLPNWAGFPPEGTYLEVIKDGNVKCKLRVDRKEFYLFGKHANLVDIELGHASCSRVHAALVYQNCVGAFLIDLGSTHGTFVGESRMKLAPHEPVPISYGTVFRFGASTRSYVIKMEGNIQQEKQGSSSSPKSGCSNELEVLQNRVKDLDLGRVVGSCTTTPQSQDGDMMKMATPSSSERKRKRSSPKVRSVSFNLKDEVMTIDEIDESSNSIPKRRKLAFQSEEDEVIPLVERSPPPSPPPLFTEGADVVEVGDRNEFFFPSFFSGLQLPFAEGGTGDDSEEATRAPAVAPAAAAVASNVTLVLNDEAGLVRERNSCSISEEEDEEEFESECEPKRKVYPKECWPKVLPEMD